ncbi:MAG: glycosyltransferase family 2 protein, partial [Nitrososphaeraceae archaeon]
DSVKKTLLSLETCQYINDCEIVLVSDGLSETDIDFLNMFKSKFDIKLIIENKCGRIGHLRNLGIAIAETDYFYFIDSDCTLNTDVLMMIMKQIPEDLILKGKNIFVGRNWISALDSQLRDERYKSRPNFAYCPNLVVHRSIFDRLGLFNSELTYGSDGDFAKRVSEIKLEVKYNENITIYHDCTNNFLGVLKKWAKLGEARYYRYKNEMVENKLSTYFPDPFNFRRGVFYNITLLISNICRAIGIFRAWKTTKLSYLCKKSM